MFFLEYLLYDDTIFIMNFVIILFKLLAFLGLFPLVYAFLLYPIILFFLALFSNKKKLNSISDEKIVVKKVSFLLPAFNEENHIEDKLNNLLSLEDSSSNVEIIVGNDGSKDKTAVIIENWIKKHPKINIHFIDQKINSGKWVMLKKMLEVASGDYLVFSDISAILPKNFLQHLNAQMNDDSIAVYAPTYSFMGKTKTKLWERLYWPLERFIRHHESQWFSTIGAHGACYAVKKAFMVKLEQLEVEGHAPINDDFLIPTFSAALANKVIRYDQAMPVMEKDSPSSPVEYRRRLRIARGNFAMNRFMTNKLPCTKYPYYYFLYQSHKVIRSFIGPLSFFSFLLFSCLNWADLRYNFFGIIFLIPCLLMSPLRASIQIFYLENRGKKQHSWL
ncbi:MAG: glycosyltransferase [Bacteriovoracaceae bacterium]